MCQEGHKEIRLRLPTGRTAGTQGKDCAELIECQREFLAQRLLVTQSSDLDPLDSSL